MSTDGTGPDVNPAGEARDAAAGDRDRASEVIKRTRPKQKDCYACMEYNYDWFCNDLTLGTQRNEGGWPKWNNHGVAFRDDGENYSHYLRGNWQGITAPMRWAMQIYAK